MVLQTEAQCRVVLLVFNAISIPFHEALIKQYHSADMVISTLKSYVLIRNRILMTDWNLGRNDVALNGVINIQENLNHILISYTNRVDSWVKKRLFSANESHYAVVVRNASLISMNAAA